MKQKNILIIIVIAILLAVAGTIVTYIYMNNNDIEYTSLNLSDTCAVSVPVSNNSTFTDDDGIKTYKDTDLVILSYNKNDFGAWENLGADIGIASGINQNFKYNHTHHGKNILIHPDDNKTVFACLISNNTTGDVIIVATSNEELLYHILDTISFNINNNTDMNNNTTTSNADKNTEEPVKTTNDKATDESDYYEGYIAENDQDFDYDGDGVGDGSAYHSHEYYVEQGQTEPVIPGGED